MNKSVTFFWLCLVLGAISASESAGPSADSLFSQWISFKAQYAKKYSSPAEEAKRLDLLAKNKLRAERFNREQSEEANYTLAVNHLSDRTDDEFKRLLGFKMPTTGGHIAELLRSGRGQTGKFLERILDSDEPVPDSIDWRKSSGRVSSVKSQGECGSCWAFSTAGVLEGQELPLKKTNKSIISLSPQNIMDCGSFSADPCDGGSMQKALEDVAAEGGIQSADDYPYLGAESSCKLDKSKVVVANQGASTLPEDEEILKKVVARYGPVSVAIEVTDEGNFRHYKSGVFSDRFCHNNSQYLSHAVLVVGYGTDPSKGGDYWIVVST